MRRRKLYRFPLGPMTAQDLNRLRAKMMNELGTPLAPSDILDDHPPNALSKVRPHPPAHTPDASPPPEDGLDDLF